jgi:transcriptional regulator with XRE-family HTH domain
MRKPLDNLKKELNDFFQAKPSAEEKAWGMILDYYHFILTYMDENNISKADLARNLNKSRSAVSQMFNKTPNITIKKMVEIADSIGVDFTLVPFYEMRKIQAEHVTEVIVYSKNYNEIPADTVPSNNLIFPFDRISVCECPEMNSEQKQYLN